MMQTRHPAAEKSRRTRAAVLVLLAVAVAAAVLVPVLLSAAPPELGDDQALAMLPAGAEILARHELRGGKVRQIEYRYAEAHTYCLVERTERTAFRYEAGAWSPAGEPEVLAETEDWSALAGTWTEQARGAAGRALCLQVTGFDGGALQGTVAYRDGTSSWEGPAEDVFGPGEKKAADRPYILQGAGFFRYNCLLADRDRGLFFDSALEPLERTFLPAELPAADDSRAEAALLERVTADWDRTWRIAAAELAVYPAPDGSGEPLETVPVGTVLACTGPLPGSGWYQAETGGLVGYVSGEGTLPLEADGSVGVADVWADVNVRAGPSQEYDLLDTVRAGSRLVYTGLEDGWYRVIDGDLEGYVAEDYVLPESVTPPEE